MNVARTAPETIEAILEEWRLGRREVVFRKLASPALSRDVIAAPDLAAPRIDIRESVAALEAFLDLLPAPDAISVLHDLIERHPACRHGLVVRAQRASAAGLNREAITDFKRALALRYDDLHVQALLIAANQALPAAERSPEMEVAAASLKGRFCGKPFSHFETTPNGDVYVCCPSYLPVPIGNVHRGSIEEIWNSPTARELRRSVLDGDFRYCSRLSCPVIQAAGLPKTSKVRRPRSRQSEESREETIFRRDLAARSVALDHGPTFVNLSHDRSCNLSCPSCRTQTIVAKPAEQEGLDRIRDRVVLPALKTADRVLITGSGDPFGSKHFRDVLDHLNPIEYPGLRVDLQTNGQLFTKREWDRLAGLHSLIGQVYVSIDAAEAETYAELRRGGSFDKLCLNMSFLARLRRDERIKRLVIAFVVQACNFRQMAAFVELGRQWGVDRISFSRLRQWGAYTPDDFARRDIFSAAHPDHDEFRTMLTSPVFADPFVWLGNATAFSTVDGTRRRRKRVRPRPQESTFDSKETPELPDVKRVLSTARLDGKPAAGGPVPRLVLG